MKKVFFLLMAIIATSTLFAQTDKTKVDTTQKAAYVCPMHPDITGTKTDKCSKCGMDLKLPKSYVCPMHADITATKKSKCSKCGMDLVEVKTKKG